MIYGHAVYGAMLEHWGETGCYSPTLKVQLPVDTTTMKLYVLNGFKE